MNNSSLYDLLREGDIDSCYRFADKASQGGEELIKYLKNLNLREKKFLNLDLSNRLLRFQKTLLMN